ncbi:two-component sensor histidine kinase [Aminobacter aganoensis]|uniref:Two-component sensor histidine kinase n=1 Tax=Aminobacter aganoensis TaxID=83264 RepID=A0A7X0KNL1_9HYPH|nr:two-component sensor histidine kinase [Aminobacter aganoensis]
MESGGPPVAPPATTGYGSKLIQSVTTYSLGGQVELKYAVGGLESEIVIPLGVPLSQIESGTCRRAS